MLPDKLGFGELVQAIGGIATILQRRATPSVDANGWTVYDHGTYKRYRKWVTATVSYAAGTAFISELNTSLPVGETTSTVFLESVSVGNNGTGAIRFNMEYANVTNPLGSAIVRTNAGAVSNIPIFALYVLVNK